MPFIEALGQQAASQALQSIFGLTLGSINDKRQLKQQEKLQNLQIKGNKEMTDYSYGKQMQMWLDTNYGAQVEQLKKAGLNPGLLYGMSGGGATTTGGGGGSVTGANAPVGGGEVPAMLGMGIQYQLLKAQKENIEADTKNKLGDAANKPLVGKNITADTENKITQNAILEIESHVKGRTQNMAIAMISTELREATEKLQIEVNNRKISDATFNDEIKKIKEEAISIFLKNEQTRKETAAIATELAQKWEQLRLQAKGLNYTEWEAQIKEDLKNYTTTHPTIGQVSGGLVDKILQLLNVK